MAQVRSTWSGRIDESNRWRSTAHRRRPELAPSVTAGVHTAFPELQKGALIEESGSHMTSWWREMDSNPRFPVKKNPLVETVLFHLQHFPFREGPRIRIRLPPSGSHVAVVLDANRQKSTADGCRRRGGVDRHLDAFLTIAIA
jgi:hypothetical protein